MESGTLNLAQAQPASGTSSGHSPAVVAFMEFSSSDVAFTPPDIKPDDGASYARGRARHHGVSQPMGLKTNRLRDINR